MSRQLIHAYHTDLAELKASTGSRRETNLRPAFGRLLRAWGKSQDLVFSEEYQRRTDKGNLIAIDGALTVKIGVPVGYWEAKDEKDDLNKEIQDKFRKGYPKNNIIFSDDVTAVLWQDGREAERAAMADVDALLALLTRFFGHERAEVAEFNKAVKQFAVDLPEILKALRNIIQEKRSSSRDFARAQDDFLKHARDAINPAVSEDDVQEMLIQHILTEDIFAKVFENPDFHRQNNVAVALIALEDKLFGYGEKQRLLKQLGPYYAAIQSTAAVIESHSEKQGFLKGLYENFYKVYNPMAADRLGVVYTPGEIVRFMIRSADWLCETHFGKNLIDKGVEILDPATGTGTFIVELMQHFSGNHEKLRHKYKEELHANEVAILPYYVANLNIEATYAAITGQFAEYPNLCFVDTLDNVAALAKTEGEQLELDVGGVTVENMARVKRQNERKISVIIGNPPYNANQQNENDNNKNRAYARIDERIKQTYIKASTAQKTKLYDMYSRFFRWASDRLTEDGVLAFITNRSFIESRTFDGFRKMVAQDFNEIWVVDLGGDVRANPKLSGTKHNVFGIQTGVAICYLVRKKGVEGCTIRYVRRPEDETAEDKLSWLGGADLKSLPMAVVKPNAKSDWINQADDDEWSQLIAMADQRTKATAIRGDERAIFKLFSLGVVTSRDDWAWDRNKEKLGQQIRFNIDVYNRHLAERNKAKGKFDFEAIYKVGEVKWTRLLRNCLEGGRKLGFDKSRIWPGAYRPFSKQSLYFDPILNEVQYQTHRLFDGKTPNPSITTMGDSSGKPYFALGIDSVPDLNFVSPGSGGTMTFSRYRHTKSGERVDNITDWAVAQFVGHYGRASSPSGEGDHPQDGGEAQAGTPDIESAGVPAGAAPPAAPAPDTESLRVPAGAAPPPPPPDTESAGVPAGASPPPPSAAVPLPRGGGITKDAIFAYCYAVLHDPLYREKYALNLKREFPRIPFYPDFAQWAAWGEALLKLHIDYETVQPAKLTRIDTPAPKRAEGTQPKPKLKSDAATGNIQIDEDTQLTGVPVQAWDYRLGNRSAIDWVLDQHKEKTPRDPTIREKFNTYRFADYKAACIELLGRVVSVSVETVAITKAMRALDRNGWE